MNQYIKALQDAIEKLEKNPLPIDDRLSCQDIDICSVKIPKEERGVRYMDVQKIHLKTSPSYSHILDENNIVIFRIWSPRERKRLALWVERKLKDLLSDFTDMDELGYEQTDFVSFKRPIGDSRCFYASIRADGIFTIMEDLKNHSANEMKNYQTGKDRKFEKMTDMVLDFESKHLDFDGFSNMNSILRDRVAYGLSK